MFLSIAGRIFALDQNPVHICAQLRWGIHPVPDFIVKKFSFRSVRFFHLHFRHDPISQSQRFLAEIVYLSQGTDPPKMTKIG